ncbi:MAG: hypothetical protein ACLR7U_10980 [Ruthenibacterium lactatiformans]
MKVAIFTETYFPFISGVVTHIKTLKESLEHAGHEVLIVTTSPKAVCHYVKDGVLYCPAILNAFTGMDCPTLSTSMPHHSDLTGHHSYPHRVQHGYLCAVCRAQAEKAHRLHTAHDV